MLMNLIEYEFNRISTSEIAKNVWDTLLTTCKEHAYFKN